MNVSLFHRSTCTKTKSPDQKIEAQDYENPRPPRKEKRHIVALTNFILPRDGRIGKSHKSLNMNGLDEVHNKLYSGKLRKNENYKVGRWRDVKVQAERRQRVPVILFNLFQFIYIRYVW